MKYKNSREKCWHKLARKVVVGDGYYKVKPTDYFKVKEQLLATVDKSDKEKSKLIGICVIHGTFEGRHCPKCNIKYEDKKKCDCGDKKNHYVWCSSLANTTTPSPLDEIEEIEKMVLEVYSDNPVLYGLHKKQCEIIDKLNLIIKELKRK